MSGEASDRTYLCHPRHLRELSLTPTMAASMGGAFHSGEDFERGRVRHVQQEERLDGVEPTDANDPPADAVGNSGLTPVESQQSETL